MRSKEIECLGNRGRILQLQQRASLSLEPLAAELKPLRQLAGAGQHPKSVLSTKGEVFRQVFFDGYLRAHPFGQVRDAEAPTAEHALDTIRATPTGEVQQGTVREGRDAHRNRLSIVAARGQSPA